MKMPTCRDIEPKKEIIRLIMLNEIEIYVGLGSSVYVGHGPSDITTIADPRSVRPVELVWHKREPPIAGLYNLT